MGEANGWIKHAASSVTQTIFKNEQQRLIKYYDLKIFFGLGDSGLFAMFSIS
jgi:hypothetical protein